MNILKFQIHKKSFTLPELLLSAAILSFALCTLLASFTACFLLNESSKNLVLATSHAQYVIEEIKNTPFANISGQIDAGNWDWNSAAIDAEGLNSIREETIDTSVSGATLLNITVDLAWKNRLGNSKSTNLTTIISQQ